MDNKASISMKGSNVISSASTANVMLAKLRPICFVFFLACCLQACIHPPQGVEPSVLGPQELELITTIKKGEDYASVGRMDLAEIELRRAMMSAPDLPAVYNDIGYSLAGQGRFREATDMYLKALELSPNDIVIENNLARNYFNLGEYEKALELYGKITSYQSEGDLQSKPARLSTINAYLSPVFHSMATIYFIIGQWDEARCYARLVPTVEPTVYRIQQYTRLLLSLNDTKGAADAVYGLLVNNAPAVTGSMMVDYGMALYVNGDVALARESFARALSREDIGYWDKQNAALFKLLISDKNSSTDPELIETAHEKFFEEYPEFCDDFRVDQHEYWPEIMIDDVTAFVDGLCNEEQ